MILRILIAVYLIGSIVFLTAARFSPDVYAAWNKGYYLWANSVDVLMGLVILFPSRNRRIFRLVFGLIAARFLAQILILFNLVSLESSRLIAIFFILTAAVCLIIFLAEIVQEWLRQK